MCKEGVGDVQGVCGRCVRRVWEMCRGLVGDVWVVCMKHV